MNNVYKFLLFLLMLANVACESIVRDDGKYSNADAVFLSINKEYTLNVDGSQKYVYGQKLKLQSHASFNYMYGDSHIQYDPTFQELNIIHSKTSNSMGVSIAGSNALNDILPLNAQNSRYYNRLREKVVSHMGTEVGALIDFKYELKSNKDYKSGLFEQIIIAQSSPVREMRIIVCVPSKLNLKYHLYNSLVRPKVEEKKCKKTYTWVFKDVEAIVNENGSPLYRGELPRLIFTTMSSNMTKELFLEHELNTKDSIFFIPILENIKKKSFRKKLQFLEIQEEVINSISLNKISFKNASYRGRSPKICWQEASANSYEKSFLLKEMLNVAGYNAEVLISVPQDLSIQMTTNPDVWAKSYVSVIDDDELYLLSSDKKNLYDSRYDLDGYKLFNPISGSVKFFPVVTNSISVDGFINMNTRKYIWGKETVSLSGKYCHAFKKGNYKYFKSMMDNTTRMSGSDEDVKRYTMVDSINSEKVKGKYFKYIFPIYNIGFSTSDLPVMTPERLSPIEIDNALKESYSYKLVYGKWYSTIKRDTNIIVENELGKVIVRYENHLASRSYIEYSRSLSLNKRIIEVSEYKSFKRLIDVWNDKKNREVYFTFK